MSGQSIASLLGEDLNADALGLGEDRDGHSLIAGYRVDRSIIHVPLAQLGDGLAGPPNDQPLQIFRDDRPIATDELGQQGPFMWEKLARHRAGRAFPLNFEWNAGIDQHLPGRAPVEDHRTMSPWYWGQEPDAHDGMLPPEVLPNPHTVFYTASPNVGWAGY
jgi:hypothetical protein